ncbi:hypothetical protein SEMRO_3939_G352010.1 [Seminavis robusta]|uniref:Uncharacterized protein n=1 Tax=Seminavis robusta TaxID=568900 RepID=A0A9N8F641_9STRA|nr:hypothetical protein SEMRO_3939_G352010.1 [Seminavis robusta]|eukprot:Sro3939_g352010.1 n/a (140) ;mRNA; f:1688-2107
MNGDNRNRKKIEAALDLVDCLWSAEDRAKSINRGFADDTTATQVYMDIDDRVKRAYHVFDNPGNKWIPNTRRSTAVTGVGNLVLRRRDGFHQEINRRMPKWTTATPITAGATLWDIVVQHEAHIKARVLAERSNKSRRR